MKAKGYRLLLLRHAKSSWDAPDLADRERPLAVRGRRAAARRGAWIAERRLRIDRVLCSPSRRTRETLALLALDPAIPVKFVDWLYLASARTLLARLRRLPKSVRSVLVIGHDPGLARRCVASPRASRPEGSPSCACPTRAGAPSLPAVPRSSASPARRISRTPSPESSRLRHTVVMRRTHARPPWLPSTPCGREAKTC
jgi:phosphohistidine phosphatase SixA